MKTSTRSTASITGIAHGVSILAPATLAATALAAARTVVCAVPSALPKKSPVSCATTTLT